LPKKHSTSSTESWHEFLREKVYGEILGLESDLGAGLLGAIVPALRGREKPVPTRPNIRETQASCLDYGRLHGLVSGTFRRRSVLILRAVNPNGGIMHNGCCARVDYAETSERLWISWALPMPYPSSRSIRRAGRNVQAFSLDVTRAGGEFSGAGKSIRPGGQGDYMLDTPVPGEAGRMVFATMARGRDGTVVFAGELATSGPRQYSVRDFGPRRRCRAVGTLKWRSRARAVELGRPALDRAPR